MDISLGRNKSTPKSVAMVSTCHKGQKTKYRSGDGTALELVLNERHCFLPRLMLTQ